LSGNDAIIVEIEHIPGTFVGRRGPKHRQKREASKAEGERKKPKNLSNPKLGRMRAFQRREKRGYRGGSSTILDAGRFSVKIETMRYRAAAEGSRRENKETPKDQRFRKKVCSVLFKGDKRLRN